MNTAVVILLCGNMVSIGDRVAFTVKRNRVANLHTGIVKGFSKKMVRVEYINRYTGKTVTSSFMPYNMIRVYEAL